MRTKNLEDKMRKLECFHSLTVIPDAWIILRLDGRSFSTLTEGLYDKPFDLAFHRTMLSVAEDLMKEFNGIYAYTESDEISVLFPPSFEMFNRSVEKLVSVSAGIASSYFYRQAVSGTFDSRICVAINEDQVVDYFRWRMDDAMRCCLNSYCYYTLLDDGFSPRKAASFLEGKNNSEKQEFLFQNKINFNDIPDWQKRGSGLHWEHYSKFGYNPKTGKECVANRRRITTKMNLPLKEEYNSFLCNILSFGEWVC